MGIPIITELNREITRLYIAGSPLAKGDPRVTKYIEPLTALGKRAPIFQALAAKLTELTQGEEQASPEKLMEAGMLINSIIYTQGNTNIEEPTEPVSFADVPLKPVKLPYSRLIRLEKLLSNQSQEHSKELVEIYESGLYRDPRLYSLYCKAITERKSFVSNFVEEQIIPALGPQMVPFLEADINLNGGKRDARLFRALYKLKGKDILAQSIKALEEGSEPVMVEALYTLSEDSACEEILVGYAKGKKAVFKQAAFTALERMGSQQAEQLILAELKAKSIGHLREVLTETQNPVLIRAVLLELKQDMPHFVNEAARLKYLLEVLAFGEEKEGLDYLQSLYQKNKQFDDMLKPLDLHSLIELLFKQDTPMKNRMVYEIACDNPVFSDYKLYAAKRLYTKEEVYNLCAKDCKKNPQLLKTIAQVYHFNSTQVQEWDWDRRWAHLFIQHGHIGTAFGSLYPDDFDGWNKLMKSVIKIIRDKKNVRYYLPYLKRLKQIGHPKYKKYYQEFLDLGCPKELLEEYTQ